ncbi:MAG: citrate synthase [Halobacterium sp.]
MTDDRQRGLEGVTVAETRLSRVDGERGELVVGGFPVEELAPNATFEETLFLLYEDRLPTADELADDRADLAEKRRVHPDALDTVADAADAGLPAMDAVRMGVAAASLARDGSEDPETDARLAVAQLPTVAAAYWRARRGEDPVDPDPDLRHAANYLYMLDGERPSEERVRGLETYLNAVVDHGLNASTFTARTVVSTESDVISGVTGAVGALKGPLHGGAPGPVLDMLEDAAEREDPAELVEEILDSGERVMGFGHRVYQVRDPRAAVLQDAAEAFYEGREERAFFDAAREFEDTAVDVLAERRPDLRLETNVEFYTAVLLRGVGVPKELFTPTFAVARAGGWTAHCLEQLEDNRLIRPRASYVGGEDREWTPVEDR